MTGVDISAQTSHNSIPVDPQWQGFVHVPYTSSMHACEEPSNSIDFDLPDMLGHACSSSSKVVDLHHLALHTVQDVCIAGAVLMSLQFDM